jgi:hypothetical protein
VPDEDLRRPPDTTAPPDPGREAYPEPVRLTSRWSRVLLALVSAAIVAVTAAQLAVTFLESAPPNTLSRHYSAQLDWWAQPWFVQNWRLFAPDPQSANTTISARLRTGAGVVGPWINLTAIDYAAVLHDPMPSHGNQNELRLAWGAYEGSTPGSARQVMLRQYLVNFVLQRIAGPASGPYTGVQLEVRTTPMTLPDSSLPVSPSVRTLPWWVLLNEGSTRT